MKKTLFHHVITSFLMAFLFMFSFHLIYASDIIWKEARPNGNADYSWRSAGMSEDGQKILVGTSGYGLYLSTDGGNTWQQQLTELGSSSYWLGLAMSGDGKTMITGV